MVSVERNFQVFTYTDSEGRTWNKRGLLDDAINAIDGSSPLTAGAPMWHDSKRFETRKAIFQDPTTFRTLRFTVYSSAAYDALTGASTVDVAIPGSGTAVTYGLIEKIPERQTVGRGTRQLADHA